MIDRVNFFKEAESKWDVYAWTYKEFDIWPVIKNNIYLKLFNQNSFVNGPSESKINSLAQLIRAKLEFEYKKKIVYLVNSLKSCPLPPADILFAAPADSRALSEGISYSRFVDPLMDILEQDGKNGLLVEFSTEFSNIMHPIYKKNRIFDWNIFSSKNDFVKFDKQHFSHLSEVNELCNALESQFKLSSFLFWNTLSKAILEVEKSLPICVSILKDIKPKAVVTVCYYSPVSMAFILASNQLNINSVDMAHGGLGHINTSYNYENLERKLNSLPNFFWVWSADDRLVLEQFFSLPNYKIILGGHPWLDFLNSKMTEDYKKNDGVIVILYTLQTTLSEVIAPLIKNAVLKQQKTMAFNFKWVFRLHPRMTKRETNFVENFLRENSLNNIVTIDYGDCNLIEALNSCNIHVSRYSGSIVEAFLQGVRTNIIIDELGKENYKTLINNGKAKFYENSENAGFLNFLVSAYQPKRKKLGTNLLSISICKILN